MKFIRLIWIFICLMLGQYVFAQAPNLAFTLRYSVVQSRFEVYARPDSTQPSFNWGPSQISIVAPVSIPNQAFNVTSIAGGAWIDNSQIYKPLADTLHDFHGVGSLGAPTGLVANVEKLIFFFTLPGGGCTPGLRLFINGTDPNSSAPGMAGGDFSNTVFAIVPGVPNGYEAYIGNYNNTGTNCNALPVASDDLFTLNEDAGAINLLVLTNDNFGGDGPSMGPIALTAAPTHGIAVVNDNGTPTTPTDDYVVYTSNANYNGADQLAYRICDLNGDCDTALVNITINPVDDFPTANDDLAALNEDAGATNIPVLTNDNFGGDGPSTGAISITVAPLHGTATVNNNLTPTNPTDDFLVYTPAANYNGSDQLTYQICDLDGDCDPAVVNITVNPVDDFPTANDDVAALNEDAGATNIPVLPNDNFGGDGPSLSAISITVAPLHGTATVNNNLTPADPTDDFLVYTPAANYNGPDQLTYQICDLDGDCDPALVNITVNPVDDFPTANDDVAALNEDAGATNIPVLTNDNFGGDGPSTGAISITVAPLHGTATVNNNLTPTNPTDDFLVYTPAANYNGPDQLTYQICDLDGDCDPALVNITVNPVDDFPTANDDVAALNEDAGATNIPVLPNDNFGGDGPSLSAISITVAPLHGTATVNNNLTPANPTDDFLVYTPAANYNGPDQLSYQICDLDGDCDPAVVNITVNPVNDPPIANNDASTTNLNTPVTTNVLANDNDTADNSPLNSASVSIVTGPGNGTLSINTTTGAITYTPNMGFSGTNTYTYMVCDQGIPLPALCATAVVTITVLSNAAPAIFNVTGGGVVCATDLIGVPVGLSGSQTGTSYQLRLNAVNSGAPVAGTGAAISFGPQLGSGTYTVVATTVTGTTAVMSGSAIVSSINCTIVVTDPCVCLNNATTLENGQFGEVITITAPGTQSWTVTAINGLYSPGSAPPPSAPFPIGIGTVLVNVGGNMFTLSGRHIDAIGYTMTVTNGLGTTLTIGNSCSYPNPAITSNLSPDFCLFSAPFTLTGTPGDANIVSATFTVNGVPATQFNPAMGVGQYLVVYTVNGGTPKAFGPNDPGCTQSVSTYVSVVATPSQLVCNDLVHVSLDVDCVTEILPDDVLEGTYGCFDDYIVELDKTAPYGNGPWVPGVVNASDVGHTYQVRVTHLVSGNKCWGNVKIEDKLPPVLVCAPFTVPCNANIAPGQPGVLLPNGLTFPSVCMSSAGALCYHVPAGCGAPQLDCSDVTLCYIDTEVQGSCASGISKTVTRKWTATDVWGNSSTCAQTIQFLVPTFADLTLPPDYDGIDAPFFLCTANAYPTPQWIEGQGLQGFPYVFGLPTGCTINWGYDDLVIDVCDGTYKIRRQWTIIDWCLGTSFEFNQIIKVVDNEGPTIACPADLTVSTDPFACCATTNLPDVILTDNCSRINNISGMIQEFSPFTGELIGMVPIGGSLTTYPGNNLWIPDTLGAFGYTPCLPIGTHTVTYVAEDDCGNTSFCTFHITVRDYVPPVASCDETTTVAIGIDDPFDCYEPADGCSGAGVTRIPATVFNDGSYDNCNGIFFTVQRMAPYSDCILGLNPINGHPDCQDIFPDFPSEFERAISESDTIKFYCCEVGTTQTVILRVYQTDENGNIAVGPDGSPIFNSCMIQVEVQDKIKPVCQSPANTTVTCTNFDPSLWAYGKPVIADNCCLDTSKVYQGQCGLEHSVNYNLFDTVCNRGTIVRTFRAYDCHGFSTSCTQRVVVNYVQDYFVKFPADVIVTVCDGTGNYGEPTFLGKDCELLGTSFEDQVFTVVPDACFKIERTWTVINWCTYNPNAGCVEVPNPNPNPIVNNAANLPGVTISALGTLPPWNPTVVKIDPADPLATNYSVFYAGGSYKTTVNGVLTTITVPPVAQVNCYRYKQIIKVIDTKAPVIANCPASPVTFCDVTPNDPFLWNESYYYDAVTGSHDLCEGPADLTITATDACSLAAVDIRYLLFLDLNGDGTMETVINSNNLPPANTVFFGNALNPNYTGGTPYAFDERLVPFNQKYRFAIQTTTSGVNKTAHVAWNTTASPNTYVVPELPYGTHKIKWFVGDGCGNEAVCEYTFIVKDCKAPTVVCLNGLSVNIMPTQMIQLWATDFLQYAQDNCTPTNQLKYGIRRSGTGTGFPVDGQGNPITNVVFTCADLGTQPVELWAIDAAGNADYCETYVIVQDNNGNCPNINGPNATVAGELKTETGVGLEEGVVELAVSSPGNPAFNILQMTPASGAYQFTDAVPPASNLTVTPSKDNNPLNGVTTYDLVLINRHILGLEPLGSPYKMIAADANKSGSITTFDIVELRKLILGIYQELPNNTSWRFVDKAFAFPNPNNPFQTLFPENISTAGVQADQLHDDFVAVKIGDVNYSAIASAQNAMEDRTMGTLLLDVYPSPSPKGEGTIETVEAGESFDLTFKTAESVQGLQFTLNLEGLKVVEIEETDQVKAGNFGVFDDALTASVDGAQEFTVRFRATKAGKLSEMLQVSSRITRAEAYTAAGACQEVALRFHSGAQSTISGVGFELYQNQPNPFVGKTFIGFHLPEAATATLTVYDESGRVLFTRKGDYAKGYNSIAVERALLNTQGLLYYKLETGTDQATRKMIQMK